MAPDANAPRIIPRSPLRRAVNGSGHPRRRMIAAGGLPPPDRNPNGLGYAIPDSPQVFFPFGLLGNDDLLVTLWSYLSRGVNDAIVARFIALAFRADTSHMYHAICDFLFYGCPMPFFAFAVHVNRIHTYLSYLAAAYEASLAADGYDRVDRLTISNGYIRNLHRALRQFLRCRWGLSRALLAHYCFDPLFDDPAFDHATDHVRFPYVMRGEAERAMGWWDRRGIEITTDHNEYPIGMVSYIGDSYDNPIDVDVRRNRYWDAAVSIETGDIPESMLVGETIVMHPRENPHVYNAMRRRQRGRESHPGAPPLPPPSPILRPRPSPPDDVDSSPPGLNI